MLDQNDTVPLLTTVLTSLCKECGSLFALKALTLLRYKEYSQLVNLPLDPGLYTESVSYLADAQIIAVIKKFPFWPSCGDPREKAIRKFIDAEVKCAQTNNRFREWDLSSSTQEVLHRAQRLLARMLGTVPTLDQLPFGFGPGSSFSVTKKTSAYHKMSSNIDCTLGSLGLGIELLNTSPGWVKSFGLCTTDESGILDQISVIQGSRLTFVPKDARADRPICVEPLLNGVIQKSYGSHIRDRLRKSKWVDIKNAQHLHKKLARQASIDGKSATIDLSSASDTISYNFVMDMLPWPWFQKLSASRSPKYTYENNWYEFQKFSSMGNGYTFELETALFLALAKACCQVMEDSGVVSCYGDDLIVPTAVAPLLIKVLEECGFDTNLEKSFTSGPFRESCGGDYFHGDDVRPFYLKDALSPRIITLWLNHWERTGIRHLFPKTRQRLLKVLKGVRACNYGPDIGTDGHLVSPSYPSGMKFFTHENKVNYTQKNLKDNFAIGYALYRQLFTGSDLYSSVYLTDKRKSIISLMLGVKNLDHYEAIGRFRGFSIRGDSRYVKRQRRNNFA
jgi:hypothetical protein